MSAKVLNILRQEHRSGAVCYQALVEYTLHGNLCAHTFPLNYHGEPSQERLAADVAQRVAACDLYAQVKPQVQADARARGCWIDQGSGEVRVQLQQPVCPRGCAVQQMADVALVLARRPRAAQRPDTAAVVRGNQ